MSKMELHYKCMTCKKVITVKVDYKDYDDWRAGKLIQKAFPYLTADEREIMISQICGKCFDKQFGEEMPIG